MKFIAHSSRLKLTTEIGKTGGYMLKYNRSCLSIFILTPLLHSMILQIYLRAAKIRGLHDDSHASIIYLYTGIFTAEERKP